MAPKPNITGFDPKKFAASSGHAKNDPWARACVTLFFLPYIPILELGADTRPEKRGGTLALSPDGTD